MVELKPMQLPFPLALSHVCWRWRQIAILEPQLWSNVQIDVSTDSYSVQLDKTHKFFSMARSPISLHVRHTGWRTGARDFITALISPFIAQIKSLSLSFPLRSLAHLFMSKGLSFRALSALEIRFTDFYLDNITENIDMRLTAFSVDSAPLLKTVKFTGENPHLFSRFSQGLLSDLYLYQLTHLEIWDMHVTVDIAFHLLRQCMALASCVLTLNGPAPANHPLLPDVEPISLQSLKKLQLEASDEGGLELFLGALALPSLADVVFYIDGNDMQWPHKAFTHLVQHSLCSLQSFRADICISSEELREILEMSPHLDTLIVPESALNHSALQDRKLVPRLRHFECANKSVLDTIKHRWASESTGMLEFFGVHCDTSHPSYDEFEWEFRKLAFIQRGAKVVVLTGYGGVQAIGLKLQGAR